MPSIVQLPVNQGGRYQTPIPAGSGATARVDFPDWTQGDNSVRQVTTRGGVSKGMTTATAGSGSFNQFNINGIDCAVHQTLLAADVSTMIFDCLTMRHNTTVGHYFSAVDQNWAKRVVVNMAAPAAQVVDNAHDFGFQIVSQSSLGGAIFGNSLAGFGVTIRSGSAIDFLIRGPNGIIQVPFTGLDTSKFHSYEIRFFSATLTQPAYLAFYIDGVLQPLSQINTQWGITGSNLPLSTNWAAGRLGWVLRTVNQCGIGGSGQLYVASATVMTAPSEANLF